MMMMMMMAAVVVVRCFFPGVVHGAGVDSSVCRGLFDAPGAVTERRPRPDAVEATFQVGHVPSFFYILVVFFRALEVGAGLVGGTIDVEPIGLETEWEDGSGVRASGSPTWPSAAPVAYCQGNSVRRLRPIYGGGRLGFIGLSPDAAVAAAGSLLVSKGEPVVVRLCVVFGVVTDWRGRFGCEEFSGVLLLLSSCLSPRLFGTGSVWGVEFSRDQSGGIDT